MPRPRKLSARQLALQERIEALTARLVAELAADPAALDLNTVDGEYFWRICQADLLRPLDEAADAHPLLSPAQRPEGPRWFFAPEEHRDQPLWEQLEAFLEATALDRRALPRHVSDAFVADRFVQRTPIPMRELDRVWVDQDGTVQIRVASPAFNGRWLAWNLANLGPASAHAPPATPAVLTSLHMDFAFVPEPPQGLPLSEEQVSPQDLPCVAVRVRPPYPPPRLVGEAYDAIVREQHRWHLELDPAGGGRQTTEISILAWATGLLARAGMSFNDALGSAETHLGREEGSTEGSQVRAAREVLVKRVPEAEPFLKQSRNWRNPFENA